MTDDISPAAGDRDDVSVADNPSAFRYELRLGDEVVGTIRYRSERSAIALLHTEVDPDLEGRGLGGRLVAWALDDIRRRGLRAVPMCSFVRSYVAEHPEYGDVVVSPDSSEE